MFIILFVAIAKVVVFVAASGAIVETTHTFVVTPIICGDFHSNERFVSFQPFQHQGSATLQQLAHKHGLKMLFCFLILSSLLSSSLSLSVNVKPNQKECFYLTAAPETPCFGSFEILSEDPTSLSITVRGPPPLQKYLHESKYSGQHAIDKHETEGSFSFTADLEGDYGLCFENSQEISSDDQLIAFNFRCVEISGDIDYEFASMQSELFELQRGLSFLKDHQSFMNQREDRHKAILESTNFKVLGWTILEALILIGMALWQVAYISKFFETKRKI